MSIIDLIVLFGTLAFIVGYGSYKTRGSRNIESYFLGNNSMKWGTIGISVMATQASAITFLSTPGQAYADGMAFVQNYFGLPIALIIISAVFIPIYYKLKVFTAYEYLESRFDLKTRLLGAFLFLLQRGLQAGITIYAPAIIISSILGWNISFTILLSGSLVIIYTVTGGTRAVSLTQKFQMGIIFLGMITAFLLIISYFPKEVSFIDALHVAGKMNKLQAVDFSFDLSKRYTFWSGMAGGLFLAMSYFGTDQSQVGRYLTGKNITESRMGLMFNAILKVPMQFFILFTGVMVFVFYQFVQPPVYFKQSAVENILMKEQKATYDSLTQAYHENFLAKKEGIIGLIGNIKNGNKAQVDASVEKVQSLESESKTIRNEVKGLMTKSQPGYDTNDTDYVFLTFILTYLPRGIVGLLLAVIFAASMSSTASELNALASTTTVDFYKRLISGNNSEKHYVIISKSLTAFWGFLAISFALFANQSENLIQAINIIASLFYGTILGIFICAFFFKTLKGTAVFAAAIMAEITVVMLHFLSINNIIHIGYLWYNAIGLMLTIIFGFIIQLFIIPSNGNPKE
jgi:solute:Na+ symporter, SSS family